MHNQIEPLHRHTTLVRRAAFAFDVRFGGPLQKRPEYKQVWVQERKRRRA
jgi:hypothetical protein